jgi:hypothetical protein
VNDQECDGERFPYRRPRSAGSFLRGDVNILYNKMQIREIYKYGASICRRSSRARLFLPFKRCSRLLLAFSYSFVFCNVHHRPAFLSFIACFPGARAKTHTAVVVLLARWKAERRPCADYGAISVYHLLSSADEIFIQNAFHHDALSGASTARRERKSLLHHRQGKSKKASKKIRHHLAATFKHMRKIVNNLEKHAFVLGLLLHSRGTCGRCWCRGKR